MKNVSSLLTVLALSLALALACDVSPAQADIDRPVTVEGIDYSDIRDFHRSVEFQTGGYRCGTALQPVSWALPEDCDGFGTSILAENDPTFDMEISVVFHAITNEAGVGHVSDELIYSQIDILNEDFSALAGTPGAPGTESRIRFALATVDPEGEPTSGIVRYADNEYFVNGFNTQRDLHWDTRRYLNIYSNEPGGILGYATFPWDALGDEDDGVIVGWRYVGRDAPDGGEYNQGRTLTHEVGHYLGLLHTFHNGCGSSAQPYTTGDLIADTQAESAEAYGCVAQESACGGDKPIHNYMNYSDDTCMDHFTPEQISRMRCVLRNYRDAQVNGLPVADFLTEADGRTFRFTSLASDEDGAVVAWEWEFGDGATSNEQSPTHTYGEYGRYQVLLTVVDDFGSRTTGTAMVLANDLPDVDFRFDGDGLAVEFTDRSVDRNGPVVAWAWDFGDGQSASEANPRHLYTEEGTYAVQLTVTDSDGGQAVATLDVTVPVVGGCTIASAPGGDGTRLIGLLLVVGAILVQRQRSRSRTACRPVRGR